MATGKWPGTTARRIGLRGLGAALVFALAAPAQAGLDDALAAYYRGDYAAALAEFLPLAEAGHPKIQTMVGAFYDEGLGVAEDDAEAAAWYLRAAEQGYAKAQHNLALMLFYGNGITQNRARALYWFRKAAAQGDENAASWVSDEDPYASTIADFMAEADGGDAGAQVLLGFLYEQGRGVPRDYVRAVKWYRMAAEAGRPAAQMSLGEMYYYGKGVARDLVLAHLWFSLAAASGYRGADRNRDTAASQMTAAQIADAEARAKAWQPHRK